MKESTILQENGKSKLVKKKKKIIHIAQNKTMKIRVNGKEIETTKAGKLLGVNISSTNFIGDISKTINKGKAILSQLSRFSKLSPNMKAIPIKSLSVPVMEHHQYQYASPPSLSKEKCKLL